MIEYGRNKKNASLLLTTDIKFTTRPASKTGQGGIIVLCKQYQSLQ